MVNEIKKVAVIGAGAMGGGIAAQAANAGLEVVLLDKFEGVAAKKVEQMKKANPASDPFNAGLMVPENAKRIQTGTTDDNMDLIADADIIIEAVAERLDIKQSLFKDVYEHAKSDAIITSNTSTLQISEIVEGMPADFKSRFLNTHFFNPPRFMHLLELISGEHTDRGVFGRVRDFGDRVLGKKVVEAKDQPAFIGNRIGVYALFRALHEGATKGTSVEDIDAIMGMAFGFPKLGMMKLVDSVGVDIIAHVGTNLSNGLSADDHFFDIYHEDIISEMVENGYTGKKGKGGFYRVKTDEDGHVMKDKSGKPMKEVKDLQTGEYRDFKPSKHFKMRINDFAKFFDDKNDAAKFAWPVLRDTLLYVLDHAEEIAFDVQSVDDAMKSGYNWKWGPFELIDQFGVDWFTQRVKEDGLDVPELLKKAGAQSFYRNRPVIDKQTGEKSRIPEVMSFDGSYSRVYHEEGVIKLSEMTMGRKPLLENESARLWDIGDGVVCVEFASKMNSLDPLVLKMINDSIKLVSDSDQYTSMVIHNEGPKFSVGANLGLIDVFNKVADNKLTRALGLSKFLKGKVEAFVEDLVYSGQAVFKAMREAPFPIVGAPMGQPQNVAFGGGAEVLLHCDAVQSGPEQVIGLVEAGVGLLPAWGGSTRYLERSQEAGGPYKGPMQSFIRAAMAIADPMNATGTNAQDSKKKLWLREHDGISMNPERVLGDAKAKAMAMVDGYEPPKPATFHLPGMGGKSAVRMNADKMYLREDDPNKGVNHVDVGVVDRIADVLSGGEYLELDDVEAGHVAKHEEYLADQIKQKPKGAIGINPSLELTESRMLQLERDNFMTLFRTDETKDRIGHMIAKNRPLRESAPDPRPDAQSIRDAFGDGARLQRRSPDGKPLSGNDAKRLDGMAKTTSRALWLAKTLKLM